MTSNLGRVRAIAEWTCLDHDVVGNWTHRLFQVLADESALVEIMVHLQEIMQEMIVNVF